MALTHVLLFFHLLGAVAFFAGAAVAGTLQVAAMRRERPSEIAGLLGLTRVGVALVGVGALLTLGFGIALAEHEGIGFSPTWIQAALGLWVAAMALGGYGGRTARHARYLAETLEAEGDTPSPELSGLVAARGPLLASYASGLILFAILGLMVWKPGNPEATYAAVFPKALQRQIVSETPQLAYLPTRLPNGLRYSRYIPQGSGDFVLQFKGPYGPDELAFSVQKARCYRPPAIRTFRVNGVRVVWGGTPDEQEAWRCITRHHVPLFVSADGPTFGADQVDTPRGRQEMLDLVTVVGYAKPIR